MCGAGLQDLIEMERVLNAYAHGGINVTGFRLVDFLQPEPKLMLDGWVGLNPESWPGAGVRSISVSMEKPGVVTCPVSIPCVVALYSKERGS